jgi:methylmalonyl-CoA/ethylmalonyl-CoA epimerase
MLGRIDHFGVAVEDLDAALELYAGRLELEVEHREVVDDQGVEAALVQVGDGHVELLCPLNPETPVGKFIERRGPGMHHVAFGVADIEAALEQARAARLRLIDEQPRMGIRHTRVAFLHPETMGGVLTELVETGGH